MANIDEIRAAYGAVAAGAEDPSYYWGAGGREAAQKAEPIVLAALDELAALRAWKERVMPLLRALADADLIERDGWEACHFCNWHAEPGHEATCPIVQARTLLVDGEAASPPGDDQ